MSIEIMTSLLTNVSSSLVNSLYDIIKNKITNEYEKKKIILDLPNKIDNQNDIQLLEGILLDEEKKLPKTESHPIATNIFQESHGATKKIREERLRQAKTTFNWAIGLTAFGVIVISIGIVLLYLGKITDGVISTAVGAVTEIISLVVFKLNKDANNRLDDVGKTLLDFEKAELGMSIIDRMVDDSKKDEAIKELSKDLHKNS